MRRLFTERHGEWMARTAEALDDTTANGLLELIAFSELQIVNPSQNLEPAFFVGRK
jgi:hypothetical protein